MEAKKKNKSRMATKNSTKNGVILEKGKNKILRQKTIANKNVWFVDFYFPPKLNLPRKKQTRKFTSYSEALNFYRFCETLLKIK